MKSYRNYLDEDTATRVLSAFEQIRGARGFTEDEAAKVLNWAGEIEFHNVFLDLVKMGKFGIDLRSDGKVIFFAISPPTLH